MSADVSEIRAAALQALQAGLSVVPPKQDGSKRPLAEWKHYQEERATEGQVRAWYAHDTRTGLGVVCGAVSGDLECLDFDELSLYDQFKARAEEAGLGELLLRVRKGYAEQTPQGAHLLYRCEAIAGNQKLAQRSKRPEEMEDPNDKIKTTIETRGEGGYVVTAPTNGAVNPSGKPYVLRSGGFDRIATISVEERRALLDLARTFDEMPPREEPARESRGRAVGGDRPGDDFDARTSWAEILEPHGWVRVFAAGEKTFWRRPGKAFGISATTNYNGSGLLYVFSTSTPFDSERGYSKFGAHALLNHGGDFAEAARALRAQGYGGSNESAGSGSAAGEGGWRAEGEQERPERWRRAQTTSLADVGPQVVTWLWPGRIPRGAVTILDGDPDLGKSTVTLDIAARVTTGRPMPDGTGGGEPADVIVVSYEDHLAATIRPRLDAAGADVSRVHALSIATEHGPDMPSLPDDLALLDETIRATGAVLVIVDPLMAALGGSVDSHRDQDVRRVLAPLARIAETSAAAALTVRHLRKSGGASPLYAGGGSIGIIGAARSALLVAADPQDPERRVLARSKCNLAAPVPSLGYRLVPAESTVAVEWLGAVGHTAGALIEAAGHGAEERTERTEAEQWLLDALRDAPRPVKDVRREARAEGIADRTLRRAKTSIGVESIKAGLREGWSWMLPPKGATKGAEHENVAPFGEGGPLRDESSTYETPPAPKAPKGAIPAPLDTFGPEEPLPPPEAGLDELEEPPW